ncbi:hypothetical protein D3C85_317840 [compost metagenome]
MERLDAFGRLLFGRFEVNGVRVPGRLRFTDVPGNRFAHGRGICVIGPGAFAIFIEGLHISCIAGGLFEIVFEELQDTDRSLV